MSKFTTLTFREGGGNTNRRRYRGRIAPTPSGKMHLGHAQTFWVAMQRAKSNSPNSSLIMRVEDLDQFRCKPHFLADIIADLHWFGIEWDFGPGAGGACINSDGENVNGDATFSASNGISLGPFEQSKRSLFFASAWETLYYKGYIYPSPHSRRDVEMAVTAPHEDDNLAGDIIFPIALRTSPDSIPKGLSEPGKVNWRFRVPDGRTIAFTDGRCGLCSYTAGVHFGDFVIWRSDGIPSYELAVVVDDAAMGVTEVVRGEDLLLSTARQLLLYEALDLTPPTFFHCPLVRDSTGRRLAKRDSKGAAPTDVPVIAGHPSPISPPRPRQEPMISEESPVKCKNSNGSDLVVSQQLTGTVVESTVKTQSRCVQKQKSLTVCPTLQALRAEGWTPEEIREQLFQWHGHRLDSNLHHMGSDY